MKIAVTGANGLLGKALCHHLLREGYSVVAVVRKANHAPTGCEPCLWDPQRTYIQSEAMERVEAVINLAGANIAEGSWTDQRIQMLIQSRTQAMETLKIYLQNHPHSIRNVVSASAIGWYGHADPPRICVESDPAGSGILAQITQAWEQSAHDLSALIPRLSIVRIGVVLATDGGALPVMAAPIQWRVGSVLGRGDQIISWIHIHDVVKIMTKLCTQGIPGIYNAVAPHPTSQREFTHTLARALRRKILLPAVPSWFLKMVLGRKSAIVLEGAQVSSAAISGAGYVFEFSSLEQALQDIFSKKN